MDEETRQPTIMRENTSITNATYTNPTQVNVRRTRLLNYRALALGQLIAPVIAIAVWMFLPF